MKKVIMWAMLAGIALSGFGALYSAAAGSVDNREMDDAWNSLLDAILLEPNLELVQVFVPAIIKKDQRRNKPNRFAHGLTAYEVANNDLKGTSLHSPSRRELEAIVDYLNPSAEEEVKEQVGQSAPTSYEEAAAPEAAASEKELLTAFEPVLLGSANLLHMYAYLYSEIIKNKAGLSPESTNKLRHYIELALMQRVYRDFLEVITEMRKKGLSYISSEQLTSNFALRYLAHDFMSKPDGAAKVNLIADVYSMEPAEPGLVALLRQIATESKSEANKNLKAMGPQKK